MSFLTRNLDLSSVEKLNEAFTTWVENDYHGRVHSVLKMKPIDRFGLDLRNVRFLPPNEVNDELFYVEESRKVLADNTFSLKAKRFEAPRDLRTRKIDGRFDRSNFCGLIARSSEGKLRATRNLCIGGMMEAVRDGTRAVDLKQINRVLLQPHWRRDSDIPF